MRADLHDFERHLAARYLPRTVAIYTAIAARFLAFLGHDRPPSHGDIEGFLARLRKGSPPSARTRNLELSALRSFGAFRVRGLAWPTNPAKDIPFAREARREPRVLSAPEIRRLFACASEASRSPFARSRALAALALLTQDAVRLSELVGLDLDRVDLEAAAIFVRRKGDAAQLLPLNGPTLAFVRAWLDERGKVACAGEPAFFLGNHGERWSARAVQRLLERLGARMGRHLTPHTLRHSAATMMVGAGIPLPDVADALGHADVTTTMVYVHLAANHARVRRAVERLGASIPVELVPLEKREGLREGAVQPIGVKNRQRRLDAQGGLSAAA